MRSLQRNFENTRHLNSYWSDFICFSEVVRKRGFCKQILVKHFNHLVDKEDYEKSEKKEIIKHLLSLTQKDP